MQKGFTLIELMSVFAIIAILAAIALPAYQGDITRVQVTTSLSDIRAGVTAFEETINRGTPLARKLNDIGLATAPPRVAARSPSPPPLARQKPLFTIAGNPIVNGKTIQMLRNRANGALACFDNSHRQVKTERLRLII